VPFSQEFCPAKEIFPSEDDEYHFLAAEGLVDLKYWHGQSVQSLKIRTMYSNRPVRDIMSTNIVTVTPDTALQEVNAIFEKHSFHHLPVVGHAGVLAGMISKTDVLRFTLQLAHRTTGPTWIQKALQSASAADIMTKSPLSLDPEDTIGLAADIFLANKFHALPIVEGDTLLGIVTTHDLLMYGFGPLAPIPEEEVELP
jgi:acetoin utilization protein AcuB